MATPFGTVRVREHTEFELKFTAPATGELAQATLSASRNVDQPVLELREAAQRLEPARTAG